MEVKKKTLQCCWEKIKMTHMDLTIIIPSTERPLVKINSLPFFFLNHILLLEVQGTSWK